MPVNIAVLTVSDSRDLAEDKSGAVLVDRLTAAGHRLADRDLVRDDVPAIVARLKGWIAAPEVDVVLATGGRADRPRCHARGFQIGVRKRNRGLR